MKHRCKPFGNEADGVWVDVVNIKATTTLLGFWKEANQDGVSRASELKALSGAGVASIKVTATQSNLSLGNGNQQSWTGSYTQTNGSTAVAADAGNLQTKVAAFAAATTRDAQMALVDGILTDWAKTSGKWPVYLSSRFRVHGSIRAFRL